MNARMKELRAKRYKTAEEEDEIVRHLATMVEEEQYQVIEQEPSWIRYIENPSEGLIRKTLEAYDYWLVRDYCEYQKIKKNGKEHIERFMAYLTPSQRRNLVEREGYMYLYLPNPSEEEKRLAITEDVMVILEMTEPSEELQLLAIQCANIIIGLLPNPSERVQLEAVNRNGYNLKYLQNPSEQIQVTALQSDGTAIEFIPNPTAEMQLIAVKQSPYALEKIEVPTEEAQWYVIKHHLDVVARLRNFTPKMQERIEKRRKAFDRLLVRKEKAVDSYFQ